MKRITASLALLLSLALVNAAFVNTALADDAPKKEDSAATKKENSATKPAQKDPNRHEGFKKDAAKGGHELLFIGDSITDGWRGQKETWEKAFGKYKPLNIGIGGDRTQHVLWRLQNGGLENVKPKAAVLMIGTNNSNGNDNTAEEIGEGITAIVKHLREKLPETKVLILAVFPRGEKPNAQREKNAKASEIASKLADDKSVFYLDIGKKFLTDDGMLTQEIMPDRLHLSKKGYEIWAEAITPKLAELMGESK